MKRFYVILVLAIAVALALAVGISKHTGYVLITYPHLLHYESSLWATLVAGICHRPGDLPDSCAVEPVEHLGRRGQPMVAA